MSGETKNDKRHKLFPDYEPEAHLDAIKGLHHRLRRWRKDCQEQVASAHECFHTDACYEATYADTACSHAFVGALAPFFEGMFHHEFTYLRYLFKGTRPPIENHPRRAALSEDEDFWNPAKHVDRDGNLSDKDNIVIGTAQLLKSLGIKNRFKQPFPQVVEALFAYRNFALHSGYEWPLERRGKFKEMITKKVWDEWFDWATVGGDPWIVTMSDKFVDECIVAAIDGKNEFERYRAEMQPPYEVPDWMRAYMLGF